MFLTQFSCQESTPNPTSEIICLTKTAELLDGLLSIPFVYLAQDLKAILSTFTPFQDRSYKSLEISSPLL